VLQPLGYVVEAAPGGGRREVNSLRDLGRALHAQTNCIRLFVIHNHDTRVLEALGVELPGRGKGVDEWAWDYPDLRQQRKPRLLTLSLRRTDDICVLLVERLQRDSARHIAPHLKRQDAATRRSTLRTTSYHGSASKGSSIEDEVCKALRDGQPLEEVLGELIFERWLVFLDALSGRECPWRKERLLYQALQSLERNQDFTRHLAKHSQSLTTPSHQDLSDLLTRLHRHILLLAAAPASPAAHTTSSLTSPASDRALNRISYLGGLLLPITVVSSVLAIEGDYGPEGGNFWVFWVASAVASLIVLACIHVDEVRGMEVWKEVAEEFGIFGQDDGTDTEDDLGSRGERRGERSVRDARGLTWERRRLGLGGAVKKVSGYYRLRGVKGLRFDRPDGR